MADNFKGLNDDTLKSTESIKSSMKDISLAARDINKELIQTNSYLASYEDQFSNISKSASKVADLQKKAQSTSKATTDAIKEQNKQLNIVKTLNIQIDNLYKAASISTGVVKYNLQKQALTLAAARDNAQQLADNFISIANDSAKLDKSTRFFTLLSGVIKDIPGLRQFSTPFEKATEAVRKQVISNVKNKEIQDKISKISEKSLATGNIKKKTLEKLGLTDITGDLTGKKAAAVLREAKEKYKVQNVALTGAKELGSSLGEFLKGPIWITALVEAAKFFVDAMFGADVRVTKLAKGLLLSKDEARALYNNFKDSKHEIDSIYNLTKDYYEAFSDLVDLSDFAVTANEKMVETQIILTKNLGLSKEEALGVQEAFAASNVEADKGKDIIYDQIAAFANQNKLIITGKKLFTDIAKTSKLIQINFNGSLNDLVKTTLEAKKLGLSLDQVKKVGESLLDFEQSISSELEAELLTGRNLNLERARAYALNHDIAGLTQEIANQGITQEKFAAMNVIQQQAIAKTLGMSAEEMGDMLYKQKIIDRVAGDTVKKLRDQAAFAKEHKRDLDAIALKRKADLLEQGILSGKSLEQAEKSASAQEKFNQSLEQAKEIFSDLVDGGYLDDLANAIKNFTNFLNGRSEGERKARKSYTSIKNSEEYKKYTPEQQQQIENLKEASNKTGFFERLIYQTFGGELGIIASEIKDYRANSASTKLNKIEQNGINAQDYVIKTLPRDTVVGAGGTKLGRTDEMVQLLTEQNRLLTSLLNKEGTIMLNGTKMGTAMAVGSYKVQ
jgi:hypothetical protein